MRTRKKSLSFPQTHLTTVEYYFRNGQAYLTLIGSEPEKQAWQFQVNMSQLEVTTVGTIVCKTYAFLEHDQSQVIRFQAHPGYSLQVGWLDLLYLGEEHEWVMDRKHFQKHQVFPHGSLQLLQLQLVGILELQPLENLTRVIPLNSRQKQ